jgi:hypothetical protein
MAGKVIHLPFWVIVCDDEFTSFELPVARRWAYPDWVARAVSDAHASCRIAKPSRWTRTLVR